MAAAGISRSEPMSASRPKLMLDEQSFQDMLAAAYTIQEHNTKRRQTYHLEPKCGRCGAKVQPGQSLCQSCSAEQVRPGEKLQQKWASMWMKSQEAGISGPFLAEASPAIDQPLTENDSGFADGSESPFLKPTVNLALREPEPELIGEDALQTVEHSPPPDDLSGIEHSTIESDAVPAPAGGSQLQLTLRFHRADLYLFVAIIISTFAMLWVLLATPAASAQRKPRLRPWERAMISLGLADAPEAPPKRGNPTAQVWVDPKTALYYCYGDERYGKTPAGHEATQREAQLDSFEPATRVACE